MKKQNNRANKIKDHLAVRILSPDKLFAFWQLQEEKIQFICKYFNIPEERTIKCLRLYDITTTKIPGSNARCIHEVILRPEVTNWLFKGINKSRDYIVEIGIIRNEEAFFPVLRSNEIISKVASRDSPAGDTIRHSPDWVGKVSTYTYYENVEGGS